MLVSYPPLGTKHTWHELAHFASPAELAVRLQLGSHFACLCVLIVPLQQPPLLIIINILPLPARVIAAS